MADILINSGKLDGLDDLKIQITETLADVRDVVEKGTLFSINVKIPASPNNNKLFGFPYDMNVYSDIDTNKKIPITLSVDDVAGIECYLQIIETIINNGKKQYSCNLIGRNNDLFSSIKNLYLSDLESLTDLNHVYSKDNIEDSWVSGSPNYFYPYIEYGSYWSLSEIQEDGVLDTNSVTSGYTWVPAIKAKYIWDSIWSEAGYTYDSSFFDTNEEFNNLYIPYTNTSLRYSSETPILHEAPVNYDFRWDWDWDPDYENLSWHERFVGGAADSDLLSEWTYTTVSNNSNEKNNYYTFDTEGVYTITLNVRGTNYYQSLSTHEDDDYVTWYVRRWDRAIVATINVPAADIGTVYTTSVDYEFIAGDQIYIDLRNNIYTTSTPGGSQYADYQGIANLDVVPKDTPMILGFSELDFKEVVPNETQIDFIKSIVKMYNLNLEKEPFSNNYLIEPRDIYYSLGNSYDWSNKFALDKEYRLSYFNDLDIKNYNFKYKDGSDYENQNYLDRNNISFGAKEIEMENDFSKNDRTIELIFAPTISKKIDGSFLWYVPNLAENDNLGESSLNTQTEPRLLFKIDIDLTAGSGETFSYNGTTQNTLYTLCHNTEPFSTGNTFIDINFNTLSEPSGLPISEYNLYNMYWSDYVSYINDKDTEVLIGYFDLTYKDYISIKFNDRFYISYFKSWFILNEISSYIIGTNDLTKIEFIKEKVGGYNDNDVTFSGFGVGSCSNFYAGDSVPVSFVAKNNSGINPAFISGTIELGGVVRDYSYTIQPGNTQYVYKSFSNVSEGNLNLIVTGSYSHIDIIEVGADIDRWEHDEYITTTVSRGQSDFDFAWVDITNNGCSYKIYPDTTVTATLDAGGGEMVTGSVTVGWVAGNSTVNKVIGNLTVPSDCDLGWRPVYLQTDIYSFTGLTYVTT